jgi:hypothetical protein
MMISRDHLGALPFNRRFPHAAALSAVTHRAATAVRFSHQASFGVRREIVHCRLVVQSPGVGVTLGGVPRPVSISSVRGSPSLRAMMRIDRSFLM